MNDMTATIVAKSDQINAADLIGKPRTVTICEVRIKAGEDQPVTMLIEGDTKAFRPCKGVRRLLVRVWGADANNYIGQSMTLFCDPKVTWAGKEEGGIRVSHMTGLNERIIEFMRVSRAATRPYEILPLSMNTQPQTKRQAAEEWASAHTEAVQNATDMDALMALIGKGAKPMAKLQTEKPDLWQAVNTAYAARRADLEREGRDTPDMGEDFGGDDE